MFRLPLVSIVVCCVFVCGCVTVPLQTPRNNISLDAIDSDQNGIIKTDAAQRTPYYKKPLFWVGMAIVAGAVVATDTGAASQ